MKKKDRNERKYLFFSFTCKETRSYGLIQSLRERAEPSMKQTWTIYIPGNRKGNRTFPEQPGTDIRERPSESRILAQTNSRLAYNR